MHTCFHTIHYGWVAELRSNIIRGKPIYCAALETMPKLD